VRPPLDSSIAGKKHMASLRLAVWAVIGPITMQVSYKTIPDVDGDGDAIPVEVQSKIGCRFEILKDSFSSGHMAGEWLRINEKE